MVKTKDNKAITLIALVVTIIILLILAGVTIGFATNGTGLFDKAKLATDRYNNEVDKENYELNELEYKIDMNSRDTVTIPKEEYEKIKANSKEIIKIEGKTPNATGSWNKICNYPDGYNMNNTKIYTYLVEIPINSSWEMNESSNAFAMRSDGIYFYTNNSAVKDQNIKLYLVKLE